MSLHFDHPEWLALLALCIPMGWAILAWAAPMSRVRRWSAVVMRLLLTALIAGAMSGASAVRTSDKLAVVAVVDVSGSVQRFFHGRDEAGQVVPATQLVRDFLSRATKGRGPEDLLGMVVFDGAAVAVAVPSRGPLPDTPLDVTFAEGSDIAQAIRLAAAMIPPDAAGRLLLFSDGNATGADPLLAAGPGRGAGVRTIPIDVVPLAYRVNDEVVVESVDAPPQAPAGATVNVRVVLESASAATGTLQLVREGQVLDINAGEPGTGRRLALSPGRHVEVVPVRLGEGRIHRFDAIWEPDSAGTGSVPGDTVASNNRAQSFTLTPGKGSVLLVDGVGNGAPDSPARTLAGVLTDAGLTVSVVRAEAFPEDLIALQQHDLVILDNVPADAVPRTSHGALSSYVTELAGGLVMLGGNQSFGAGAWKGTDVEPILPVSLDLPEKLIIPAAAVVLVLDNSGSMNRPVMGSIRTQQEIANEGAALAVQTMDKTDLVGVITFNSDFSVDVPLGKNATPDATARAIRSIAADGGTNLPPALAEAGRQLNAVTADVKHVIVLSDGASNDKDRLPAIAKKLADDGIKVSTIAVGDSADLKTMADIASSGGGEYYRVIDPNTLPRIFVKAIRVIRSPLVREGAFPPVVLATGSPMVQGLAGPPPQLYGINLTQARDTPTVTNAMAHPNGEPLLAHWSAGLGRVTAFTSDASRWAREWIEWPGYRTFWTQVARTTARPAIDRFQELTTEIVNDELRVRLDATGDDGHPLDMLDVPGSVYLPTGERVPVRLAQTGPGTYEGAVAAPLSGTYVVTLTPRAGAGRALTPVLGGVSRSTGLEYRTLASNVQLLRQLADDTHARVFDLQDPNPAGLFDRTGVAPSEARVPLWRAILLWAVVVMLLDVATRRVAWDRWLTREFGRSVRREAAEAVRDRGEQSARLTERLRGKAEEIQSVSTASARERPQAAPLSEEDAKRIVFEQAQRRLRERQERAAARVREPLDDPPPPSAKPPIASPTEAPAEGLFAAKARARKRMEDQDSSNAG
jgi:uncharacterized membrane protein